jgi:RecG-like helicase
MERVMAEFFRSSLIILMALTVIAAGVLVVFYG